MLGALFLLQLATPGQDPPDRGWAFTVSVYGYRIPDDRDYLQPTVTADFHALHLEARYNYEDRDTGSIWIGTTFKLGSDVTLEATPMAAGVFGRTDGVALGLRASLRAWRLELSTESEYVRDVHDASDSFLYTWSELTLSPVDWLRAGLVVQRTKVYEADFDVQRGVLARLTFDPVEITAAVFNPTRRPIVVLGIAVDF